MTATAYIVYRDRRETLNLAVPDGDDSEVGRELLTQIAGRFPRGWTAKIGEGACRAIGRAIREENACRQRT